MNRWLLLLVLAACLVPVAAADDPGVPLGATDRVVQLQRNYTLIKSLVQSGLRLAAEEDPLKRAEHCLSMADPMIVEIQLAAGRLEMSRAAELAEHLQSLFEQGLVANLAQARKRTPFGSAQEGNLLDVRDRALQILRTLEEKLEARLVSEATNDGRELVKTVQAIREKVERLF
jgi:hypothetical protein